ncbi:MAG TPA: biosynthetic peptidoglycan transglycosylase, partial [Elusimicrobiales bacterium]|nr:biosynthetic peptidoglycan transglycosylase [Elusimicrobiales bacterium]
MMEAVRKFLERLHALPHEELVTRAVYAAALAAAAVVLCASLIMRKILSDIPSVDKLDEYKPALTTYVYDINNQVIAEFSIENRAMLPLSSIPLDLQNAVIAMEDTDFFKHWGVSPKGIARALLRDLVHIRRAQGGSTITQQLSRGIFLTSEKTVVRKIKEMVLALQIESNFSKQEILQLYLNQIYLGSVWGVQSAAKLYFGKNVQELTLPECALLVGIIPNPGRFSPFSNPDRARLRRYL